VKRTTLRGAAVKAPPTAPAPVPTWTGFYGGIQFGGGWGDEAVNYSPNDPFWVALFSGAIGGGQGLARNYRIQQSGAVGGFEAGYNWQAGSNWLWGLEADFSFAGMSGTASNTDTVQPSCHAHDHGPTGHRLVWDSSRAPWLACNS
jgi:outer membrane immunogenic protein